MSMLVMCTIELVVVISGIPFVQKGQVTGKVLSDNNINYLVDFSEDANKRELRGDYSNRLVPKSACIKLE